jgi:hypothetical protein
LTDMSPYPCKALPLQRRTKARTATLTGHYRGFAATESREM